MCSHFCYKIHSIQVMQGPKVKFFSTWTRKNGFIRKLLDISMRSKILRTRCARSAQNFSYLNAKFGHFLPIFTTLSTVRYMSLSVSTLWGPPPLSVMYSTTLRDGPPCYICFSFGWRGTSLPNSQHLGVSYRVKYMRTVETDGS